MPCHPAQGHTTVVAPPPGTQQAQQYQLLSRRASRPPARWLTTALQLGFGRRRERKMLALPETIAVLGTDIPFGYAAGGFVLALIVMGGKHQLSACVLGSSFRPTSISYRFGRPTDLAMVNECACSWRLTIFQRTAQQAGPDRTI